MRKWFASLFTIMIDKYALSYGDEEKYNYSSSNESPLEEQHLEYDFIEDITGKKF